MRIVSIIGSKREGNTFKIVNAASEAINSKAKIETITIGNINYSFCDGCLTCDETGECHFNDDMKDVIEKIKSADGLIIGTPARWGLLSGELKSLFDRLNPLARTEELAGKKAIILTVGQSEENTEEADSIKQACSSVEIFCINADIEVVDKVYVYSCLNIDDVLNNDKAISQCMKAAKKLLKSLK